MCSSADVGSDALLLVLLNPPLLLLLVLLVLLVLRAPCKINPAPRGWCATLFSASTDALKNIPAC